MFTYVINFLFARIHDSPFECLVFILNDEMLTTLKSTTNPLQKEVKKQENELQFKCP